MKFPVPLPKFGAVLGTLAALVLSFGIAGCGDDEPTAPPPTYGVKLTVMHANASITSAVQFKQDTALIGTIAFGATASAERPSGGRTVRVLATDGSELVRTDITLDSTSNPMVIFSGTLTQKDIFTVRSTLINPAATNAAVRVVNASNNAGDIVVKIGSVNGLALNAANLAYKGSTAYVELPLATTTLVIVKPGTTEEVLTIDVAAQFAAGKSYTLVVYGSADPAAAPSVKLQSKLIAD